MATLTIMMPVKQKQMVNDKHLGGNYPRYLYLIDSCISKEYHAFVPVTFIPHQKSEDSSLVVFLITGL